MAQECRAAVKYNSESMVANTRMKIDKHDESNQPVFRGLPGERLLA